MPTYSYKRPVRVLIDDSSKYVYEHMTHYFNTNCRAAFYDSPQEVREQLYEMFTDYEDVLTKVYGDALVKSTILLPKLYREGIENEFNEVKAYKEWLDKR
jgi:hypothetical protein